jgi:hypothetical protein
MFSTPDFFLFLSSIRLQKLLLTCIELYDILFFINKIYSTCAIEM